MNTNAAMLGAQYAYGLLPGTDRDTISGIIIGILSCCLAIAAGKVVFGLVPKVGHAGGCDCSGRLGGGQPVWV